MKPILCLHPMLCQVHICMAIQRQVACVIQSILHTVVFTSFWLQAVLEDSLTKGDVSQMIKELQGQQTVETATPKQISILREAMPHTPVAQLNSMSKDQASRLINAYFKLKQAKKGKGTPRKDSPNKDDGGDGAAGGAANTA